MSKPAELELTIRELESIAKHLAKVHEVHRLNNAEESEVDLGIPLRISLNRVDNGIILGHVQFSEDLNEYVFIPHVEEEPEPPKWVGSIPMPNF